MSYNIDIVCSADLAYPGLKEYILGHKDSSFYHLPAFVKILAEESGQNYTFFICKDEYKNIIGYIPVVSTRGFPFNFGAPFASKRYSSLPRTPYCGPLYDSEKVLFSLLSRLKNFALNDPSLNIQIKSIIKFDSVDPELQTFFWRNSFIKEIPPLGSKIYYKSNQIEKEVSRTVRKAERDGIVFMEADNLNDLHSWYKIYLENSRFHFAPARSLSFFVSLWNEFYPKGMLKLNLIIDKNNLNSGPIAGTINYRFKDKVWGAYKGRLVKHRIKYADDLLHYYEFLQAQNNDINFFDLGEVAEDDIGLASYKRKWGIHETGIYHYYYSNNNIEFNEVKHSASQTNILKRIWGLIPLNATGFVGKGINRFL